jgi:hypothetical protein
MVPGSQVGEPGQDSVEAQRSYQNTRTLWIEPVTGAIIKGREQQLATIDYNSQPKVTATQVSIEYDEATVKKNIDGAREDGRDEGGYQSKAAQLHLIGFWVPLISLIIGLLLFAVVAFFQLWPRVRRSAAR